MKFEYFSPKTVEVLRNAHKKASELGFEDVGTDHILLALTENPELFSMIGCDNMQVRHEVSALVGTSDYPDEAKSYTMRAKTVLEDSLKEIDHIREITVEPAHLLMSLMKQPDGVAVRALKNLDIDLTESTARLRTAIRA